MKVLRLIASQTGYQLIGKIVSSVTTLFSLSLITNHYGVELTGLYTLILTYLAFFYLIADLGVNAFALPLLERSNSVFEKVLGFRLILSVILIIISIVCGYFIFDSSGAFFLGVLLGSLSIIGSAVYVTCNLVFQKYFRYDLSVISASIMSILSGLLIYLLISEQVSVTTLVFITTVVWLFCGIISLVFVRKFVRLGVIIDWKFMERIIFEAWPISLALILNVLYFRIDSFLLNHFRNLSEVGIYNFSYQFFQTALVLPTFIMNGLYPLLLEKDERSPHLVKGFIFKALAIMLFIGMLGAIVTWIVSPVIINLVAYRGGFVESIAVLRILGLSFPAFFGSAVLMWSLVTFRLNKKMLSIYLVGFCVNLFLNFVLIPQGGYIAAAWVTVACEYMIFGMQMFLIIQHFNHGN